MSLTEKFAINSRFGYKQERVNRRGNDGYNKVS